MQFIEFPSDMVQKEDKDTSIYQYRKGYNLQFESESIIYGRKEVYESVCEKGKAKRKTQRYRSKTI